MEEQYKLRSVTPETNQCIMGSCPAIYEALHDVTPKENQCIIGSCPAIHASENTYVIIGKKVDIVKAGLEGKVGSDETVIEIPKEIIDNKSR